MILEQSTRENEIGGEQILVLFNKCLKVTAADLLLTLDQKVDLQRQRALSRQPGLDPDARRLRSVLRHAEHVDQQRLQPAERERSALRLLQPQSEPGVHAGLMVS